MSARFIGIAMQVPSKAEKNSVGTILYHGAGTLCKSMSAPKAETTVCVVVIPVTEATEDVAAFSKTPIGLMRPPEIERMKLNTTKERITATSAIPKPQPIFSEVYMLDAHARIPIKPPKIAPRTVSCGSLSAR